MRTKSIRKKTIVILALLVVVTMTLSCSEEDLKLESLDAPEMILNTADLTVGNISTLVSFDPYEGEFPESIAVDRFGNIYVSMIRLQEIWKLDPEGNFVEVVASFPLYDGLFGVVGLRFDTQGNLYAGVVSPFEDIHGFWIISPDGEKERIPGSGNITSINDVAISPNGTVYMTDSSGAIWRYTGSGQAEIWVQDETLEGTGDYGLPIPIGANGIVVVPGQKMPFARDSGQKSVGGVLVSNAEKGQLVYIPILKDGTAGEPFVVISDPALFGLDGITLDARGNIYGTANWLNSVVRISRDGSTITQIAQGGLLDFPTGLAFGTGTDRHTLFVVNVAFGAALEDANPSVVSISLEPGQGRGGGRN
ncbi:MAG TPA: SMP-30/gluconolactonase/LRE family protein [Gillisia sp.]|nr:SMP-30/gluconolactonase/LRE family protein [Gillisia sp.]